MPSASQPAFRFTPRHGATLAIIGGWLWFYAQPIFSSLVPYERDLVLTTIPMRQFLVEELKAGRFPQWYPYELLGIPFSGSIVASPFHPQSLLLLLFSPAVATKWNLLLTVLFGLAGAYRLARRLKVSRVAAVSGAYAFVFGGYFSSLYYNLPYFVPLATAPWMLAAVVRIGARQNLRDVAALAFWWALVFLGGDIQLTFECGFVGVGLILLSGPTRSKLLRFAAGGALAAAVAGAELLPALYFGEESNRAFYKPSVALARAWALYPLRLAEFFGAGIIPKAWIEVLGKKIGNQSNYFIFTFFAGGVTLALAALGAMQRSRYAIAAAGTALLGILLALGDHSGLLELVWTIAPPLVKFRYPEKWTALFALMLIFLVPIGVDTLRKRAKPAIIVSAVLGAALLLLAMAGRSHSFLPHVMEWTNIPGDTTDALATAMENTWAPTLIKTGFAVLLLAVVVVLQTREARALWLVPALVFGELWIGNGGMLKLVTPSVLEETPPFARLLKESEQPGSPPTRVESMDVRSTPESPTEDGTVRWIQQTLTADDGGRSHIDSMNSNDPAELWRVIRTLWAKRRADLSVWFPRLNACHRVALTSDPLRPDEAVLDSDPAGFVLLRRPCLPRAYFARAIPVDNVTEAQGHVSDGMPPDVVYWEGGPALDNVDGSVRWVEYVPTHLQLETQAAAPGALVVTDAFASGWTARVDGQPAPIFATNAMVRGLALPAGHHLVEMEYRAPGFMAGCWLTAIGVVAMLGLVRASRRERRATPERKPRGKGELFPVFTR